MGRGVIGGCERAVRARRGLIGPADGNDADVRVHIWKINVRIVAAVPESVPEINVPLTPPRRAVMSVALFAVMMTMIIPARLAPLPMIDDKCRRGNRGYAPTKA